MCFVRFVSPPGNVLFRVLSRVCPGYDGELRQVSKVLSRVLSGAGWGAVAGSPGCGGAQGDVQGAV